MKKIYCLIILILIFNNHIALSKDILEETLIYRGNIAFDQETDEPISGTVIQNYDDGKIKSEGEYVDGVKVGEWKTYFESSELESSINFMEGEKDGPFKFFHQNGELKAIGSYKNGKEDGNWLELKEDGKFLYIAN